MFKKHLLQNKKIKRPLQGANKIMSKLHYNRRNVECDELWYHINEDNTISFTNIDKRFGYSVTIDATDVKKMLNKIINNLNKNSGEVYVKQQKNAKQHEN
jgi:hypothetical protein